MAPGVRLALVVGASVPVGPVVVGVVDYANVATDPDVTFGIGVVAWGLVVASYSFFRVATDQWLGTRLLGALALGALAGILVFATVMALLIAVLPST